MLMLIICTRWARDRVKSFYSNKGSIGEVGCFIAGPLLAVGMAFYLYVLAGERAYNVWYFSSKIVGRDLPLKVEFAANEFIKRLQSCPSEKACATIVAQVVAINEISFAKYCGSASPV